MSAGGLEGAGPGAAERRGSGPGALASEHYGRPSPLPADSVRRPSHGPPPPACASPGSLGGACVSPLGPPPSGSRAGLSPPGSLRHPAPCRPPDPGSMFTFSFECQQRGSLQEVPVGRQGPGKSHTCAPLSSPPRARGGPPGQAQLLAPPLRVPDPEHAWRLFVYKLHLLAP